MNKETAPTKKKGTIFVYLSFFALFALFILLSNILLLIYRPSLFLLYPLLPCIGFVFGLLAIRHNLKTHSTSWAILSIIGAVLNFVLLISVAITFNFSLSAYGACRKMAMNQEGYGVWEHQSTTQEKEFVWITFFDGTNELSCQVNSVGPFWAVTSNMQTLVGCAKSFGVQEIPCPRDHFGVSP